MAVARAQQTLEVAAAGLVGFGPLGSARPLLALATGVVIVTAAG